MNWNRRSRPLNGWYGRLFFPLSRETKSNHAEVRAWLGTVPFHPARQFFDNFRFFSLILCMHKRHELCVSGAPPPSAVCRAAPVTEPGSSTPRRRLSSAGNWEKFASTRWDIQRLFLCSINSGDRWWMSGWLFLLWCCCTALLPRHLQL